MSKKNKRKIFKILKSVKLFRQDFLRGLFYKSFKRISLFTLVFLIIFGQLLSPGVADAATFNFIQNSWAGGATGNVATHVSNQNGWNQFQSKNNLDTSSGASLTVTPVTVTQTTATDLAGGTNSQTAVTGSPDASVTLGKVNFTTPMIAAGTLTSYTLKSDGTVWAWGAGGSGQIGDGTTAARSTATQVLGPGGVGFLTGITSIAAVNNQSAYALKSDGTVWAWGSNAQGQLGDNTIVSKSTPVEVIDSSGVGFLTGVVSIAAGQNAAYAVKSDGSVWAWGFNTNGQLGDNTITERNIPVHVHDVGNVGFLTGVTAVTANGASAYARKSDGTVWSWGANGSAQLGDNTAVEEHTPVQVHGTGNVGFLTGITSIASAGSAAYALKSDNTVWSWGLNTSGQLGDNTLTQRNTPVQVHGTGNVGFLTGISSITAGGTAAYALKSSDGSIWSWGANTSGQLGDNTITQRNTPVQVLGPGAVGFLTGIAFVAAGNSFAFSLKPDGTVWSWGSNGSGQLGDNTSTQRNVPVQVLHSDLGILNIGTTGVASISSGTSSAYALKSDGTVWSWGRNDLGQLGDNTISTRVVPAQVVGSGGVGFLTGITSIAGGGFTVYALKSDGTVWSWGSEGGHDALGDFIQSGQSTTPVQLHGPGNVGLFAGATAIGAGDTTGYAIKSPGTVWAWGFGGYGQLGNNTALDIYSPDEVHGTGNVGFLTGITSVIGSTNTNTGAMYAIKSGGTLWSSGLSQFGELGDNTVTQRLTPVQVVGAGGAGFLSGITSVSGSYHSAYARKSDGTAWAWGYNGAGQLGDNTAVEEHAPIQVHGPGNVGFLTGVASVASANQSAYALKTDGTVWAWGLNTSGQLGDNTIVNKSTPVQVLGPGGVGFLTGITAISAGASSAYALKSDGTVWAWGLNTLGQLGDNTMIDEHTPVNVTTFSTPVAFNAGTTGYFTSGNYTSNVIDLASLAQFTTLTYSTTLAGQTVTVDVRAGDTPSLSGAWTTNVASGASIASLGSHRYVQYRVNLATADSTVTPSLDSITINATQNPLTGDLTSSVYDSVNSSNLISKLSWTASGTSGTETVKFQIRSSPDGSTWSAWCGYADCSGSTYFNSTDSGVSLATNHPLRSGSDDRYLQYKAFLTSNGAATPVLSNVQVTYVVNVAPAFNVDYPTTGAGGVTAAQNGDPANADFAKVNISYSAKDTDTASGTITPNQMIPSFEYSIDGGGSWNAIPSGDMAAGDTSLKTILGGAFTTYSATWSASKTVPGTSVLNAKIRVSVNDSEAANNISTATTANFALDTKAPVSAGAVTFDAGIAGVPNSATVNIIMPTDQSAVQYMISDDPASQTSPTTTGWTNITSNTTIPWSFDSDIEVKSLKYQFKDAFGNTTSELTVSTHVPVPSNSFLVQDTSNVASTPPLYDLFIGWQATDPTGFTSYRLEQATSSDNITYSSYSLISAPGLTDVATNFFVYRNLNPNLFYRFRLGVVGTNGNISVRSNSFTTTKPDGVQNFGEGGGGSVSSASKVENVVVTQNIDRTVTVNYKLTDSSSAKKVNPSYEAYLFYNIGITLPVNALSGNTITVSDASRLQTSGFILINNEVIKYTGKTGNILTGITRGTWPTLNSSGRITRQNTIFFGGTNVWINANGTTPIAIPNTTIVTGQNGSIAWNTNSETALAGAMYPNTGIKVLVHDNQDALSGPLSSQNDFSENGIINNLDLTAPVISFSATSGSALESVTPAVLTLNLDRAYPFNASVNYTLSGTAIGGTDYTLANGTATITAGQTTTSISIPIVNHSTNRTNKTIIVTLSGPTNATLGTNTVFTYTIINHGTDTTPPVVTLLGLNPMHVLSGTVFTDPGATSLDDTDGDITAGIVVTGAPNMSVPSLTPYTVTYTSTDSSGNVGTATRNVFVDDATQVTFDITATAGANGTITPAGVTAVTTHTDQAYAITPGAGYAVATLSVDNINLAPATTYTFANVTATHTIAATFVKISDVTAPVITLIGTNPMSVVLGGSFVDPGATAVDAVDGSVGITTTGTVNANALGTYTLTYSAVDLSGNQSLLTRTVNVILAVTYDITATAGANGTITPAGVTAVIGNANQAYAITPASGYSVASLSVDNVSLAPATTYTFANVTATHTIAVTFVNIANGPVPQIGFNSAVSQGLENAGTVTIPVSITALYVGDVSVSYTVTGGTAVGGGVDYTLANGTLTIPSGQSSANIPLVLVNSNIFGPTKTVVISLSNPVNAALGINTVNTFFILNSNIVVINTGNNVKATSAIITWTTDAYTDSKVEYGTVDPGADPANPAAGAYNLAKYNATPVLNHRIYLNNLTPSTHYFFRTISTDLSLVATASTSDFTTTPGPVLSAVNSGSVTDTSSTITWTTDIPSTSYVTYSVNPDLSVPVRFGSDELVTSHSVVLLNLDSAKTYFYKVESADAALNGNLAEETNDEAFYTFITSTDVTPPVISEITAPIITPIQAAVVWKTNEVADGKVRYGLSAGSYENESALITTPMTNHLAALSGLTASTKYYYVIVSADASGNSATSPEQTFTTTAPNTVFVDNTTNNSAVSGVTQELYDILLAENVANKALIKPIDIVAPIVSNIQISGITAFGATVSFETDKDTVAFIEYGKDHSYGLLAADQNYAKTHSVKLNGLTLGTDYFLKINAMDKSNNIGTSDEQTFKTQFLSENLAELQKIDNVEQFQSEIEATIQSILPSLVAPFIDKPVVSDITENSATITFHTNIKSYPIVSYTTDSNYDAAKTNPYDGEISDTTEKAVSHTLGLIGLQANTKYHAMAKAFSLPQVVGKSDDFTFTTAASKIQGSVIAIKKDSFTVVWVTDEPASSIVEYKNLKTGITSRVVDDVKSTSHSVLIENLTPGTSYQVSISGINGKGNLVEGAAAINARTSIDNIPPVITNLKFNSALVAGRTDIVQTIISWQTDEPATSIVHYEQGSSTSNKELANKQEDLELTRNHVVILTALKPGTVYRYAVDSKDAADNTTNSPVRTTITPKQGESIVDIILKNFNSTFNFINNVK